MYFVVGYRLRKVVQTALNVWDACEHRSHLQTKKIQPIRNHNVTI